MKSWVIAGAVVLLALAAAGVRIANDASVRARLLQTPPDSIATDAELMSYARSHGAPAYEQHCASCHGAQLQGDLVRHVPNLADADWLYGSGRVGEIERVVLYGIRAGQSKGWDLADMPAYGRQNPYRRYQIEPLVPKEIADLVAYLQSFQHPPTDPAAAARGAKLYSDTDRGACWDCHAADAKGDSAIGAPDLTDNIWLAGDGSPQSIQDAITFGLAGSCPAWIDRLPPATVRAVAAYVHSHQPTPRGTHGQ